MTAISSSSDKNIMREPLLAGILSFLFMGLGQAYNGQRRKGYMFFISYILLAILYFILLKVFNEPFPKHGEKKSLTSPSYIITLICSFLLWVFNIYDAYQSAKRVNAGSVIINSTPGKSAFIFLRNIVLWFIGIVVTIFLILILVIAFAK